MNTQEWLDDIEDEIAVAGIKVSWDRFQLLTWASVELNKISQEHPTADCFHIHLNPAVYTVDGTRNYDLPSNFGTNFVPAGGDQGDKFVCMIDDGTSETPLDFVSTAQFYSMNLRGEGEGIPSKYTIITTSNGRKQIALSPIPNAAYEIDGLYCPTDWDLATMDSVPPLPGNSAILKYSVLHRINPKWDQDYSLARVNLVMEFARNKQTRFVPNYSANKNYSLMRR